MFVSIYDSAFQEASAETLGGKGYGLWWMQQQGINVPPALILPTSTCVEYMQNPQAVMAAIEKYLPTVYEFFQEKFGFMPLVSVRSGARVSMPGMMDTILNVGLDESNLDYWSERLGEACMLDSRKRLIEMYGNVVQGIDRSYFDGKTSVDCVTIYREQVGGDDFPAAKAQLLGAIEAVFNSWNNERAKVYRALHKIPEDWGTAVVIQAMVFGNFNDQSGTGVLFTRNPDSGANGVVGEFLINAQGEDVVAGIRTPMSLGKMPKWNKQVALEVLEVAEKLEHLKRDVQDVEFTIQDGKLYVLQTRNAKRSARAAVKIALDFYKEGAIGREEALKRVSAKQYDLSNLPVIDPKFKKAPAFTGIPACSGVACGKIVRSAQAAIECKEPCILVTKETTPDDLAGMIAARGVLTMEGGMTSHAAVVARAMNKPCVVGLTHDIEQFAEGATVAIDGATGRVWFEQVPVIDPKADALVAEFNALLYADASLVPYFDIKKGVPAGLKRAIVRIVDLPYCAAEEALGKLGAVASDLDVLYVDLTGKMEAHEQDFLTVLGGKVTEADLRGVLKLLDDHVYASKMVSIDTLSDLKTSKVGRLTVTTDVHDLLMSEHPAMYGGAMSTLAQRVLALKAKAGEPVEAMGQFTPGKKTLASNAKIVANLLG